MKDMPPSDARTLWRWGSPASVDRFERDRERVSGRHVWISDNPDLAAEQLVQQWGPDKATRLFVVGRWTTRRMVRGDRNLREDNNAFSDWCATVADGVQMYEEVDSAA